MRTTSQKGMFICIQTKGEEKFLDDSRGGLSALWGSWKKLLKVVNFGGVFLRSFLQKIRKILLNAVLTPQESLNNLVLKKKKMKKKGVKKAKNMLLVFGKVKLGVKKNCLGKYRNICFQHDFTKHHQIAKKRD